MRKINVDNLFVLQLDFYHCSLFNYIFSPWTFICGERYVSGDYKAVLRIRSVTFKPKCNDSY
jgi:hypothetical protein